MASQSVDYLLIGGGLACGTAAEALRQAAHNSSIMLVAREPDPPYERPPCSKGYLRGEERREDALVQQLSWYEEHRVELLTRTSVTGLDANAFSARLSTGEDVTFARALIATGANVRRVAVKGGELEGLHYLRTLANSDAIRVEAQNAEHIVLIGGSFIACEVAASLTATGSSCAIVMQEEAPLERVFGARAGRFFGDALASHGVAIHAGDELAAFEGEGRVRKVLTRNGLELPAELVVIGVGVTPEVRLAKAAGLETGERGGVRCSTRLETSVPGIFAAGDMCEYDSPMYGGPIRVEHWDVALNQGRVAAQNMAGEDAPYEVVPYFFSDFADWVSLEYVGPAYRWDEEILRGSFEEGTFTNWYLQGSRVVAALTVGRSEDLDHARRLIRESRSLDDAERAALGEAEGDLASLGD
jgi:3-phenylpropionate/trans-cinnamate dioxygenase ferredoxin reductase subunit